MSDIVNNSTPVVVSSTSVSTLWDRFVASAKVEAHRLIGALVGAGSAYAVVVHTDFTHLETVAVGGIAALLSYIINKAVIAKVKL